jgi:hypothetical protein
MSDINRKDGGRSVMIAGSFTDRDSAESAYESLIARGYTDKEIHVIMSDETRKGLYDKSGKTDKNIEITQGHKTLKGGAVGGMVGGAVGATLLALIAAGTSIALPGIGLLIAGPLAGALAGGATGATAGGMVGLLVGAGIQEERARLYEKDLKGGAVILGVQPRHDEDAAYFEREWQAQGQHVYR